MPPRVYGGRGSRGEAWRPVRMLVLSGLVVSAAGISLFLLVRVLGSSANFDNTDNSRAARKTMLLDGTLAGVIASSNQPLVHHHQGEQARDAAAGMPIDLSDTERVSSFVENAEFQGEALKWGPNNLQPTAEACAQQCIETATCNAWVWCGAESGCGGEDLGRHKACWVKRQAALDPAKPEGSHKSKGILWTSGAVYTEHELRVANQQRAMRERLERERLQALRDNTTLPLVFFDVEVKGVPLGRIEMVLFTHTSPLAAENFRALCTGERGVVPADDLPGRVGIGLPYHFKDTYFYRIIDRFIDQTGSNTDSVYGGAFKDEPGALALKHDRAGLLSLANGGPNTNGGHFSIVVAPAPHLNGNYGIFGEVVSGQDVMYAINAVAAGRRDNMAGREQGIMIAQSGQLRYGTASHLLQAHYPATAAKLVKRPDELFAI